MMKSMTVNRRSVTLIILIGLLLGAGFAGMQAFNGSPALAQSVDGDAGEIEDNGADDAAEGPDVPITGTALEQASAAALEYMGEGRVTETEVGDEEGYYEVEITLENGRQVDVHLDEAFNILGHKND
ncbi:MAG: PepSY domain-containing protein [Anaerolineales bacterium]|nr:PepSY domain-containing protein [Anaerolineales bacterium]